MELIYLIPGVISFYIVHSFILKNTPREESNIVLLTEYIVNTAISGMIFVFLLLVFVDNEDVALKNLPSILSGANINTVLILIVSSVGLTIFIITILEKLKVGLTNDIGSTSYKKYFSKLMKIEDLDSIKTLNDIKNYKKPSGFIIKKYERILETRLIKKFLSLFSIKNNTKKQLSPNYLPARITLIKSGEKFCGQILSIYTNPWEFKEFIIDHATEEIMQSIKEADKPIMTYVDVNNEISIELFKRKGQNNG